MLTRRVFDALGKNYWVRTRVSFVDTSPLTFLTQDANDTLELLFVVLNYVTCVPVLLLVGGFRHVILLQPLLANMLTEQVACTIYTVFSGILPQSKDGRRTKLRL